MEKKNILAELKPFRRVYSCKYVFYLHISGNTTIYAVVHLSLRVTAIAARFDDLS